MEKPKIRRPVYAGQFYPSSPQELRRQIESFVAAGTKDKLAAIACMLPHAGYMYSGAVAAKTLSRVEISDTVILLGPNHTGFGAECSIVSDGAWQTPLGEVEIDRGLAAKILGSSKYLTEDNLAHAQEHSLEVQLPLLQYFKSGFQIVPIAFLTDRIAVLKEVGRGIAAAIKESGPKNRVLIVASSDMTHYEPKEEAQRKDSEAIGAISELDEDKLMARIRQFNITMCGYAPVVAMLSAAKLLGAHKAELVKYQTSGDVTGDDDSVVGYAGMVVI